MNLNQELLMVIVAACASLAFFAWFSLGNGALELEYWLFRTHCRLGMTKFQIQRAIANMLPRWLVEVATIRLIAHATTGKYGSTDVNELRAMTALRRWDKK